VKGEEQTAATVSRRQQASSDQRLAILFDGRCGLCTSSIKWVSRLDWLDRFASRDLIQWEEIARDFPSLEHQKAVEEMHLVMPDGRVLTGFYAFRKIARHLPVAWLIWPFLFVPGVPFVGAKIYRFIARRRLRHDAACELHAQGVAHGRGHGTKDSFNSLNQFTQKGIKLG
jgi:predicted DCC family thiol-disulfide oxidoreductase YuxK